MKNLMIVDVTRMDHGNCCIAGVCREEGDKLYRLCLPYITQAEARKLAMEPGRVFVGVFERAPTATSPHVEDCNWFIDAASGLAMDATLKSYLEQSCVSDLDAGLGIWEKGTDVAGYAGKGRSIVTLVPKRLMSLEVMSFKSGNTDGEKPKLKAGFLVPGQYFRHISVNDFRFYNLDGTINSEMVERAQACLDKWREGALDLYLRVGLTRSWKDKYWLQVDGLHFFNKPTGAYLRNFELSADALKVA